MHDSLQVFERLSTLQSTLPNMELKPQELQKYNCLYSSTWVTELENQDRAILVYVAALWHTLQQIPAEYGAWKGLVAYWGAEATRLRKSLDATGSKFSIYIGVRILPDVTNDKC
jgi:hypothetical protein